MLMVDYYLDKTPFALRTRTVFYLKSKIIFGKNYY